MSDVISVWPCDHGGVEVERIAVPLGATCAQCGARAVHYVPRDRYREALTAVTALLEQQTGFSGGSLPSTDPWDEIEIEINEAVRKAKAALADPSSREQKL